MKTNPFVSKTYVHIWSKHFNNFKVGRILNFIENGSLIKNKFPSSYENFGVYLTIGITYQLKEKQFDDIKGKAFFVRDILKRMKKC